MRHFSIILASCILLAAGCTRAAGVSVQLDEDPPIFPDYSGVTVPRNIAPLNFRLDAPGDASFAILSAGELSVRISGPEFRIPTRKWEALKAQGDINVSICHKDNAEWKAFRPFTIIVSNDTIDPYVAYRLIQPGYETWNKMGLYQRCLESFEETAFMTNSQTERNCMNCHSFCNRDPQKMMFHMRVKNGGTYTWNNGKIEKLNTKTPQTLSALVYPRWHPGGHHIGFSVNDIAQFFHTTNPNRIEVYDSVSDVVVYDVDKHEIFTSPLLSDPDRFETFPAFSADGSTLYFCSSPAQKVPQGYKDIRYSICSISFNPETREFGNKVDTVYSAARSGRGATFPRVSPDGRFLLFTETDYGCFAVWHHDADLHLISLADNSEWALDGANSDDAESYHCWSSNSRWIIYISRRLDGLFSRLYICHIDEDGHAAKAFLMPQKDTRYYERELRSYNVPEFITGTVDFSMEEMAGIAKSDPGIDVTFSQTNE